MHLLFVLYSLGAGGAERVTSTLANYWALQGHDVSVVTFTASTVDFYVLDPPIRRISLNLASASIGPGSAVRANFGRALALRRVLTQQQPDVAIAMMPTANTLLAIAALGLPGLVTLGSERIHPPELSIGRFWGVLRWCSYALLDAVVAQTDRSAAWIRHHTLARRVVVIENPLSPLPLTKPPLISPLTLIAPHKQVLLAVGRLEYQKGFDLLLDAFARVARRHLHWQLVILGEGNDRPALERLRLIARLEDRVVLPGRVGNVSDWYDRADLFVLSSRFEGFPNVLAEAMAAGLSVVSTDCPTGPADLVRDGVNGRLVPVDDAVALAEALDGLMANGMARQALGSEARQLSSRLALGRIATRWERLFIKA